MSNGDTSSDQKPDVKAGKLFLYAIASCAVGLLITIGVVILGLNEVSSDLVEKLLSPGFVVATAVCGPMMHNPFALLVCILANAVFYGLVLFMIGIALEAYRKWRFRHR